MPETAIDRMSNAFFKGTTRRSPISYLNSLRLWGYDFRGKKILDVGSGRARFAQLLNYIYGGDGTQAIGLDIDKPRVGVRADAQLMPFKDGSFDLVTNHMMVRNFWNSPTGYNILEEMLRVTRSNGEIRITFRSSDFDSNPAWAINFLEYHPAVDSVVFHKSTIWHPSFHHTLVVHIKNQKPSHQEIASYHDQIERQGHYAPRHLERLRISEDLLSRANQGNVQARIEFITLLELRMLRSLGTNVDPVPTWLNEPNVPQSLIVRFAHMFSEGDFYGETTLLTNTWGLLPQSVHERMMQYWLETKGFDITYSRILKRLPGPYSPETQAQLKLYRELEIKIAAEIEERRDSFHP